MSTGYVRDDRGQLSPIYPIYVEGPTGKCDVFLAQIDTGFSGHLVLPREKTLELELEYVRDIPATFANAAVEDVPSYRALTRWEDKWMQISVMATGVKPLIGMELLRGRSFCFDAVDMGAISIKPLDRRSDSSKTQNHLK